MAREAALKIKCQQEGLELLNVSYYYKNGRKVKRSKMKKICTSVETCPVSPQVSSTDRIKVEQANQKIKDLQINKV